MVVKFFLRIILLSCLLSGSIGQDTGSYSLINANIPTQAPIIDVESHLRSGRSLQNTGTQDVGEACDRCNDNCKDGLFCKGDGICICGFCDAGTCTVSPTPAPTPEPSSFCFSAPSTVQTRDKGAVSMNDLKVGDKIMTDAKSNKYEEVYAFGHWNPKAEATFVQLYSSTEFKSLELTGDHMLKVNGRFTKASSARVGDTVETGGELPSVITKINLITRRDGVYAPLTPSGTLLVDNVLVSAYVSLQDRGDEYPQFANGLTVPVSQQFGIHMFLSPYRIACTGMKLEGFCHSVTREGISTYVDTGMQLAQYADALPMSLQLVLLFLATVCIVPLYVLEVVFGAQYVPFVVFVIVTLILKQHQSNLSKKNKKVL